MNFELWILLIANGIILSIVFFFGIFIYPKRPLSEETKRREKSFISNSFFREAWYFLMEPFKRKLVEWNVEPNTITIWGVIFSILGGVAFAFGLFGLGGWFVVLASTCDVYDGMLARARKISLKSGAFFDSTLDRLGESAMFFGLTWFFKDSAFWFCALFILFAASQIVSYSRARGLGFFGARGFFQRAERMIVLSVGMTLNPLVDYFAGTSFLLVKIALVIMCVGSVQTAITRCWSIYREMRAVEKE